MVLIGHGIGFAQRSPALIPLVAAHSPVWLLTSSPEAGVWIFFTLSGYLIGKGFWSARYRPTAASVGRFYRNRALRILPVYWSTLTIFSLLSIPAIFRPQNLPAFANMLLFNLDGHLPYMPIGALWSISTEMQFYAAAPLLFILIRPLVHRPAIAWLAAAALMAAGIGYRAHAFAAGGLTGWYHNAYAPLFINLDLFLLGMAAAYRVAQARPRRHGLAFGAAALVCLYVIDTYLRAYGVLTQHPAVTALFTIAGPTLTALLTVLAIRFFESAPKQKPPSRAYRFLHPTETVGLLTYAVYSWHEPIFLLVKNHLPPPSTILLSEALWLVTILAVFILAAAAYRFIERPFETMKSTGG